VGRYTLSVIRHMKLEMVLLLLVLLVGVQAEGQVLETLHVRASDGESTPLDSWLAERGPAVLLIWATWAPRSEQSLVVLDELQAACAERDLALVVVDVQEPFEAGWDVFAGGDVPWVHDRHGVLLKHFRVIKIPRLLVISSDGDLVQQSAVSVDFVRNWGQD
jgi:hypothetical protein